MSISRREKTGERRQKEPEFARLVVEVELHKIIQKNGVNNVRARARKRKRDEPRQRKNRETRKTKGYEKRGGRKVIIEQSRLKRAKEEKRVTSVTHIPPSH